MTDNKMSLQDNKMSLQELKVDPLVHLSKGHRNRKIESEKARHANMTSRGGEFVYVNPSYVGSMNSMSGHHLEAGPSASVIREQYWTCARWPSTQRVLAVAVAILLGTVVGLTITMIIRRLEPELVVFRTRGAPD